MDVHIEHLFNDHCLIPLDPWFALQGQTDILRRNYINKTIVIDMFRLKHVR